MKRKRDIIETYDAIAEDFDITRYRPWPETVGFAKLFEEGDLVLDLGCGNGRDTRHFDSLGMEVLGLDISRGQLNVVRRRADALPILVQGDVCALPIRDNVADGAILAATLHHLPDPESRNDALRETFRCIKPGGLALVGVWAREQHKFEVNFRDAKESLSEDWEPGDMLLDWRLPNDSVFKRYYHMFSEEEFDNLLASSDFKVERRWFSCDNHYALLMRP
jgi:tRNA (uracil-5-)-methyltransferase TRM9